MRTTALVALVMIGANRRRRAQRSGGTDSLAESDASTTLDAGDSSDGGVCAVTTSCAR